VFIQKCRVGRGLKGGWASPYCVAGNTDITNSPQNSRAFIVDLDYVVKDFLGVVKDFLGVVNDFLRVVNDFLGVWEQLSELGILGVLASWSFRASLHARRADPMRLR